jgi:hypothetical protein
MAFGNDITAGTIAPTQNNGDALLKEIYIDGLERVYFENNPTLALMPKKEDLGTGRNFEHAIIAGAGQAINRQVAGSTSGLGIQSQAGLTGDNYFTFVVPKYENFLDATVSARAIAETSSDRGAFANILTEATDNALIAMGRDTSISIFHTQDGNIGQVGGSVAGTTLTFANPSDVYNVSNGQFLDFAQTNSGTTLRALASSNTACQITAVDYAQNIVTVKWTGSGTQTLTANNVVVGDYIYRSGAKSFSINGIPDWIPFGGVSSSDSFNGVNRSLIANMLSGSSIDATAGNLRENLIRAAVQVQKLQGKFKTFVMDWGAYGQLLNLEGSKVQHVNVAATDVEIGFEGLQVITGPMGSCVVVPDNACPSNTVFGLNLPSWYLGSHKEVVHIWDPDNIGAWLRSSSAWGLELRCYSLSNLACKRPVDNINIRINPYV